MENPITYKWQSDKPLDELTKQTIQNKVEISVASLINSNCIHSVLIEVKSNGLFSISTDCFDANLELNKKRADNEEAILYERAKIAAFDASAKATFDWLKPGDYDIIKSNGRLFLTITRELDAEKVRELNALFKNRFR